MKAKLATSLFLAGSLLALPMASYADKVDASGKHETMKEQTGDAWITTKIKAEFAKDKLVGATRIHVDTDKGVVKLTGNAKSKAEADQAVALAKNIKGVTDVKNDIQVGALGATGSSGASGSTSYGR
jgi:osmotically-inducible protein OsmY